MEKGIMLCVVSVAGGMLFCTQLTAQVSLTGASYTEAFDSIGGGLPLGWSVWVGGTSSSLGTAASFETNPTSWGDSAGEFRNCASVTNNAGDLDVGASATAQHAFTNRVLAVRQGSGFGDPGAAFVFQLANTTGLSNVQFAVDFLMLDDEGRDTAWTVDYGIGVAPTTFATLGVFTNRGAAGTVARETYALGTDADDQSEVVTLRVGALEESSGSGSRDTFGLDNVRLSFDGAAMATPIALDLEQYGKELVLSWSDASFALQAASTLTGVYTNMPEATSPHTNTIDRAQMFFRLIK